MRSAESTNPGRAFQRATGAGNRMASQDILAPENAAAGLALTRVFYWDQRSNSVQALGELRAVLA